MAVVYSPLGSGLTIRGKWIKFAVSCTDQALHLIRLLLIMPRFYVSLRISCQSGNGCDLKMLQLGKTTGCFYPLAKFIATSDMMRDSPQTEVFNVSSSLIPTSPVPNVCGIFSSRDLCSLPGRQTKAIAKAYIVLECDLESPASNSEESSPCPLGFC